MKRLLLIAAVAGGALWLGLSSPASARSLSREDDDEQVAKKKRHRDGGSRDDEEREEDFSRRPH